jgi:hypothetical protein
MSRPAAGSSRQSNSGLAALLAASYLGEAGEAGGAAG